mgnify:FL=1
MRIAVVAPSVYMSEKTYPERIFAPRIVVLQLVEGLVNKGHDVTLFSAPDIKTKAKLVGGPANLLMGNLLRDKYLNREILMEYRLQSATESRDFYTLDLIGKALWEDKKQKFDIIQTDDPLFHPFVELSNATVCFIFHDPLPRRESLDFWFLNNYKKHNFISISMAQRIGEPALNFVGNAYHGLNEKVYLPSFEEGKYVAYFGRLLVQKGPDLAIRAAMEAGEPIKIASDKTHFNTEFVKKNVLPFVNGDKVEHVGLMVTSEEKSAFLGNAKATLFPIQWDEPFGLVVTESMACGTPVIVYNRGSIQELVKDGVTGFIIDPDNEDRPGKGAWTIKKQGIEGLVEGIKRIGEIDRRVCRKHVEENFTIEKMVDGYENIYQKLLSQ